ncbi:MAG: DUF1282 family protein [Gammaproteobacteria bacterium]|nr:DUF1282 family protein [Gammaproteobacteria bacterium]
MIAHILGLFIHPTDEWRAIKDTRMTLAQAMACVLVLAAIPVVCGFIGTTQFGWQIGTSATVRLSTASASVIAVLYYIVIVTAVLSVGWMIHWMGATYGAAQSLTQCIVLAAFIPVPLFLVGVFQLAPILWLNLIVNLPALAYTVFLLYLGIPVFMEIPAERGFLFASAVLAVGLVGLVGMLAVTVILWGIGVAPVFVS